MRTKVAGLGLALAAALLPGAAGAHDHAPPEAHLLTENDSGAGVRYTTTWARGNGESCVVTGGDGIWAWDAPPVQWVPDSPIAVRFSTRHRPTRVEVTGYLLGDPTTGTVIFGEVDVPAELRRVHVNGRTRWEAVLSPPPWPDLYLDVAARWKDAGGCHRQEAGWTFRAGLVPDIT
jgi:hypothetical protein